MSSWGYVYLLMLSIIILKLFALLSWPMSIKWSEMSVTVDYTSPRSLFLKIILNILSTPQKYTVSNCSSVFQNLLTSALLEVLIHPQHGSNSTCCVTTRNNNTLSQECLLPGQGHSDWKCDRSHIMQSTKIFYNKMHQIWETICSQQFNAIHTSLNWTAAIQQSHKTLLWPLRRQINIMLCCREEKRNSKGDRAKYRRKRIIGWWTFLRTPVNQLTNFLFILLRNSFMGQKGSHGVKDVFDYSPTPPRRKR